MMNNKLNKIIKFSLCQVSVNIGALNTFTHRIKDS